MARAKELCALLFLFRRVNTRRSKKRVNERLLRNDSDGKHFVTVLMEYQKQ